MSGLEDSDNPASMLTLLSFVLFLLKFRQMPTWSSPKAQFNISKVTLNLSPQKNPAIQVFHISKMVRSCIHLFKPTYGLHIVLPFYSLA